MTVEFDDVQRASAMLAEALLGRPVRIEVDGDQPVSGRRPLAAWEPDLIVVLPERIDVSGEAEHDRRLFRHAVVHQAAYELFGTRAFDVAQFLQRHADRPALEETFTAIEERRLDAAVCRRFPGAVPDVERAALHARERDDLRAALDGLATRTDIARWTVEDSAALALAWCPVGERQGFVTPLSGEEIELPSTPDGPPATQGGGGSDDPQAQFDPLSMNPLGFAADVEDIPEGNQAHGLAGGGLPEESPRRGRLTGELETTRRTAGAAPQPKDTGTDRSYLYDEWDVHGRRYLQAWCRVHERPLSGGDPAFIADVRRRHATLARHVRRQFSMISPESWRRQRRELDGGELDLDEVVASVVNRRMGIIDDDHLHIRQVRSKREVAAAFLLDMSASTSSPVVDPDAPAPPAPPAPDDDAGHPGYWWFDNAQPPPPERRVLDLAKESLALMCDALQVLGDEHAIYGFSGAGRDCVDFYIAKDLHEASSARTWGRLAAMKPRQYTRMGPAIRHATAKLRCHPARTRFLVVLSDGYPQDQDYGPDRNDRGYGIADTAKALEEAERAGVLTFCITVDPAGHDYLRQMCPDDRYLVIDDVNALPGELTKLYRTLVLSRG